MKYFWAAALLLLLGGCAAPSLLIKEWYGSDGVPAVACAPDSLSTPTETWSETANDGDAEVAADADGFLILTDDEILSDDEQSLAGDEALDSECDPETLEDTRLLAGEDQLPPDEEGASVALSEAAVTFDLPVVVNDKVRYYIENFSGPNEKVFRRWLERSGRYVPMMQQILAEEGLPLDLVWLAMIESGFNDRAYSWAHASGPWQFIEGTGRVYGLDHDWWRDERRDPVKATRAAARHLKDLYAQFGDWYLVMAAYNAGAGKVSRGIERYGTTDFWELSHGDYLQPETKNYVPKFLAALLIAREPEKYGFFDLDYLQPLRYETARLPSTTDIEIVADLCQVDYDTIKNLNPELKRWCTPPGVRDYEIRIPAGGEDFMAKYRRIPAERRANYAQHKVRSGDTLSGIAKKYKIRVDDIVTMNKISNPRSLRIGASLILPLKPGLGPLRSSDLADAPRSSSRKTYTVRKGDSLWKIAQRFGTSEKALRSLNSLGRKTTLQPGQTLIVSVPGGSSTRKAAAQEKQKPATRKIVYKVKAGDTVWGIGRRFDVAARQILDWNNLGEEDVLQPGDRLTLLVREDRKG